MGSVQPVVGLRSGTQRQNLNLYHLKIDDAFKAMCLLMHRPACIEGAAYHHHVSCADLDFSLCSLAGGFGTDSQP